MDAKTRDLVETYTPFAKHALRLEKGGNWYHCLKQFPGVLFDGNGFVVFGNRE